MRLIERKLRHLSCQEAEVDVRAYEEAVPPHGIVFLCIVRVKMMA